MNLQSFRQKLGVFAGVIVFSFNVVTTVQTDNRPQVRARVVFADGTPLVNANIYVIVADSSFDGRGFGYSGGTQQTGSDGYFVATLDGNDDGFYMVGVAYQERFAKAPPFICHKGQPQVHLLLTLNDDQVPPDDRWRPDQTFKTLQGFLEPPTVWVVNPLNGHAYKKIFCPDIMEATPLAAAENAYLVSINDAAEEEWILGIFDLEDFFWIGLSDAAEEGQWAWHSGEPVTYTNWMDNVQYGGNTEVNDYVTFVWGDKWQAVAPGGQYAPFLKAAILESVDLPVKTQSDKQTDVQPTGTSTPPDKTPTPQTERSVPSQQMRSLSEIGAWAVNPANGHAYKKIRCRSLDDAKNRATAEGAHLVTINDAAEQQWLLGLFRNHLYWIGLSDAEKEGEWAWQNGEPLTYTNWGAKHSFPRSTLLPEEKDSAVMTFLNGQWHAVGPGDLFWNVTKFAILEKPDMFDNSLTGEE